VRCLTGRLCKIFPAAGSRGRAEGFRAGPGKGRFGIGDCRYRDKTK